ncbi:thymidine kinase [Klebsiella phage vB_Kpn_AM_K6]
MLPTTIPQCGTVSADSSLFLKTTSNAFSDFRGELFEGSKALLSVADKLVELKGVCHCGRKATMVARIDENGNAITDGEVVELGGEDKYVSLCRKHWCELVGVYNEAKNV